MKDSTPVATERVKAAKRPALRRHVAGRPPPPTRSRVDVPDARTPKTIEVETTGKRSINFEFHDSKAPSRGASLKTRSTWAIGYLRYFLSGEKVSEKEVRLAVKWIEEALVEAQDHLERRTR